MKKETLEEAAENYAEEVCNGQFPIEYTRQQVVNHTKNDFIQGAKWQQERMYSEEEVLELLLRSKIETSNLYYEDMKDWFEQFKKR
jgi:hypothetical protein